MSYLFYLGDMQLPIAPPKLEIKINNNNKTVTLINDGEINIIKSPGLSDISFEILIPNVKYPFANYSSGFQKATYYLERIKKLKTDGKAFQFVVTRTKPNGDYLFDTDIKVTLEDYTIIEDADKYGMDVAASIKLKQYRDYCTTVLSMKNKGYKSAILSGSNKTSTTKKVATIEQNRSSDKTISKTHTIKSGETLWAICQKELGDGSRYAEIAKLNNLSNVNLIKVGQVIKLG